MLRFLLGGFLSVTILSGCSLAVSFDELTHGASGRGSGGAGGASTTSSGGAGAGSTSSGGGGGSSSSSGGGTGIFDCKGQELSASGFPSTPCLDKFNRDSLNAGSPANWTTQWVAAGTTENIPAYFAIDSKHLNASNKYDGEGNPDAGLIVWKPEPFGTSQEVYLDIVGNNTFGDGAEVALVLKNQYSSEDQDIAHEASSIQVVLANPTLGGGGGGGGGWPSDLDLGFYVYSCTTSCTLVGAPLMVDWYLLTNSRIGARAYNDGTVEVYLNGSLKMVRTVDEFKGLGGHVGVRTAGNYGPWEWEFDNFGGGTIPDRP